MPYDDTVLDELAREILSVDERGESIVPLYTSIIERGLPTPLAPDAERRDVIVIGAGIAGLVTGKLLKDAGYNVTILEANDSRVGGRVKTFHTTAEDGSAFNDPLQYAEAGAMRIPTTHPLVNALIRVMGLGDRLQPFYNVDIEKDSPAGKPVVAMRTWTYTNGALARRGDYQSGKLPPEQRTLGFPVSEEWAEPADVLLSRALAPVNELIDATLPIDEQIAGWKEVLEKYDPYSMYRYLTDVGGFPETVVEYVGTLQNLTSRLFLSFLHSFIDTFYLKAGASYVELAGGNWQLPYAFLPHLEEELVMDSRVVEIQWSDGETVSAPKAVHQGRPGVYVRAVNEPTTKRGRTRPGRVRFEREMTADYLVVTIPFSALRFVNVAPAFHYEKSRAITELHYDSATKVLLEFDERFWEWGEEEWRRRVGGEFRGHDSFGGGSLTDRPIRFAYFPSHRVPGSKGGVVLASYTWADDASRWDSIPAEDRYNYALDGLVEIYGVGIKKFFTGCGRTESWMENYYAYGEAAVFTPGQLVHLHPHVRCPEGPLVHFAGEHTSLKHAWIEGAIESAIRATLEIHGQP